MGDYLFKNQHLWSSGNELEWASKKIETDGIFIPVFSRIGSPYWETGFKDKLIDFLELKNYSEI
mgnify:CR=1 FL=1